LTNEEASEANNKILRHVRLHHARKTSWQDHLTDLYHRAMDVSDPVILEMASKNRKKHKLQKKPFSPEILHFSNLRSCQSWTMKMIQVKIQTHLNGRSPSFGKALDVYSYLLQPLKTSSEA
jgi:hypothetical protein